jgi:hypothetical protein
VAQVSSCLQDQAVHLRTVLTSEQWGGGNACGTAVRQTLQVYCLLQQQQGPGLARCQ